MSGRHRESRPSATSKLTRVLLAVGLSLPVLALLGSLPAQGSDSVTRSETLTRVHLLNGVDQVVDSRQFSVTVDTASGLRDRQPVRVTWQGAHPTGGIAGDQQSRLAADEEYPVVIMQCRGVDSPTAPASQRLSPETCWTHTPDERSRFDSFLFPPYRLDRYETPANRQEVVGAPSPLPTECAATAGQAQRWVPFVGADGHEYDEGYNGCAGLPPEAVAYYESALQPSNTTYGVTNLDGTGETKFVINTAESNASLGCSSSVACSLVIVPIMGISCDPAAASLPAADRPPKSFQASATTRCTADGKYRPGAFSSGFPDSEDLAVSGRLWWSASNWRNHISIPLGFAAGDNLCEVLNHSAPVYVYGSESIVQATTQWAPHFCLDSKLFKFQHVQTGEPAAKNLLGAGSIEAAFAESPPDNGFTRPVVQAPVAVTGFGIAFSIDDVHRKPVADLKLTPRLLAKLLTESYASNSTVKSEYSTKIGDTTYDTLRHNPLDIGADPEFIALNPGLPQIALYPEAAATLFAISSDSDVMTALTSYINADPDARAWLDGSPDPWGMQVNPHYKGIQLPVDNWPLLDDAKPADLYGPNNPCLATSPVPWLPQVAAPVQSLQQVSLNMQYDIAGSQIYCANAGQANEKLTSIGREPIGQRFILGLVPLADAQRYSLNTAALLTRTSPDAPGTFTDATGRTFVTPSTDSLEAATKMLRPDATLGTWTLPYADLRTAAEGAGAYPGTLLVSADVATSGVTPTDAKRLAALLRFIASDGQKAGLGTGLLPPGFLPMTAATGLGSLADYTRRAADAVAAQNGSVPSITGPADGGGTTTTVSSHHAPGGTHGDVAPVTPVVRGTGPVASAPLPPTGPVGGTRPSTATPAAAAAVGYTRAIVAGAGALALPLVALVVVIAATGAALIWLQTAWRARR